MYSSKNVVFMLPDIKSFLLHCLQIFELQEEGGWWGGCPQFSRLVSDDGIFNPGFTVVGKSQLICSHISWGWQAGSIHPCSQDVPWREEINTPYKWEKEGGGISQLQREKKREKKPKLEMKIKRISLKWSCDSAVRFFFSSPGRCK